MQGKTRAITGPLSWLVISVTVVVTLLTLDQIRLFGDPLLSTWVSLETHFYYALIGLLLPLAFLVYRYADSPRFNLVLLDAAFALGSVYCCFWLFQHSIQILDEGWEFVAPDEAVWVSLVLWLLVMEAVRRVGGAVLFVLVLLFSFFPLVADQMPEMLSGISIGLKETASYHAMSSESLLGLPFRAFANLVIGFLVFGVALQHTGGGQFFIDFAFSLFGKVRGGPAKVSILSSGLMGSMSGSVITNVLTTGQLTIPAMKKSGIAPRVAAGVEACASTGGVLLPPVMGSTAFVMATFLEVPYYQVAIAAAIPALLYFVALFIQIDAYAAKEGLGGVDEAEIPPMVSTLKEGWYYLAALALLVYLLVVLQRESLAPWAATLALLIVNQFSPRHSFDLEKLLGFVRATGVLLSELLVILSGVGLIVGALSVTGLSGTLINELLFMAGGSVGVLLIMGAVTSFILGIGMTVTAAYIFLAIVLAPALIEGGLNPMAVHLFILYWGMLSFITPPVALGAFAAASISGSNSVETGFTAMRLGVATYFVPFFFVFEPALVLQGDPVTAIYTFIEVLIGVWLVAGAAQAHLPMVGSIKSGVAQWLLGAAGLLIACPDLASLDLPLSNLVTLTMGVVAAIGVMLVFRQDSEKHPARN